MKTLCPVWLLSLCGCTASWCRSDSCTATRVHEQYEKYVAHKHAPSHRRLDALYDNCPLHVVASRTHRHDDLLRRVHER